MSLLSLKIPFAEITAKPFIFKSFKYINKKAPLVFSQQRLNTKFTMQHVQLPTESMKKGLFIPMKTESDSIFHSQALKKLTATQLVLANKMGSSTGLRSNNPFMVKISQMPPLLQAMPAELKVHRLTHKKKKQ